MSLEPPDPKRCQAEHTADTNFMTLGGPPVGSMVRCSNKPTVIVRETKPGSDGQMGAMSLCAECLTVFVDKVPQGTYEFEEIKDEVD